MKLHAFVALLNGKKTKNLGEIGELHKRNQKAELFNGKTRTYRPLDDNDEKLPAETVALQEYADKQVGRADHLWADWMNIVLTVDTGSTQTSGDITIDGNVIMERVPVITLIFIEQQLNDIRKYYDTLPVLDTNFKWSYDSNKGCWVTGAIEKNRSVKKNEAITLAVATDKHPAQVQLVAVDKWVGVFTETAMSSALPRDVKRAYVDRIDKLIDAVKKAREEANSIDVTERKEIKAIFDYIHSED